MFEEGVYANYAPASLYSNYSNYSELEVSHSPLTNAYIQPEFCKFGTDLFIFEFMIAGVAKY